MTAFIRQADIRYQSFYIEKKHISDVAQATDKLSRQISFLSAGTMKNSFLLIQ